MSAQTWGPTSFFELTNDRSADRTARIQKHLSFMVDYLRAREVQELTSSQQQNRSCLIDRLDAYWQEGVFPHNRIRPGFSPIFIDPDGRACAMADLMVHSGARDLAECVAASQNTAYVRDITEPGVAEWIINSGLTVEECAMIQPAYFCGKLLNLSCDSLGDDVVLSWQFPGPVDWVEIYRDGDWIAYIEGEPTTFVDADLPPGQYSYYVRAELSLTCFYTGECIQNHHSLSFIRGDVDGDGVFEGLGDTLFLLGYGFQGGPIPPCLEAADADGNDTLNTLIDSIYIFTHAFYSGPAPLSPHPECGTDSEPSSSLGCEEAPGCA